MATEGTRGKESAAEQVDANDNAHVQPVASRTSLPSLTLLWSISRERGTVVV
jgi:hypothetical protein